MVLKLPLEILKNNIPDYLIIVDLDGTLTLPHVNNTFDFLKLLLFENYGILGYVKYIIASRIVSILNKVSRNEIALRRVYITLLSFGIKYNTLVRYALERWIPRIIPYLNMELIKAIEELKKKGYRVILATACIEIPAKIYCKLLRLDDCISTELKILHGMVIGVSTDTYGFLKFITLLRRYSMKSLVNAIYIADKSSVNIEHADKFVKKIIIA